MGGLTFLPLEKVFFCSIVSGALDPRMIFPTPRHAAFVGTGARGSGTENPPVEVVEIQFSVPLEVLADKGPDWKTPMSSFRSEGATVKVLSHNWLSTVDHCNDLLVAAFCRIFMSYTHQPNPLWYLAA